MPGPAFSPMPHVVAVEHEAVQPLLVQLVVDQVRDRALAAGAQAGEPNDAALVAIELFALFASDAMFVPGHIGVVSHGQPQSSLFIRPAGIFRFDRSTILPEAPGGRKGAGSRRAARHGETAEFISAWCPQLDAQ